MHKLFSKRVADGRRTLKLAAALIAVTLLTFGFSRSAKAQDQEQDDPPGRVARLGYIEGSVSFQPAGENEWVEAAPNRPMTTGDKLWADQGAHAEVQLGSAMIHLAPNTGFSFLNLDDRTIQMEVTAGAISIRVWNLDRDNVFEVDTPNQAFTVTEPGRYRVETSENGDYTVVTIRAGAGESSGNGQSYTLHAGQRTTFRGTTSLNAEVEQIGEPDSFDNWADRREHRYDDSPSARYCSRRVVGFEDLDDNGDWRPTPEYGNVWYPRVDPDWAPYHNGHWAWIDPWGWTWVDDDPWGYAPFHYGRWVSVEGRWGWIPGPIEERPVYAPALVAFVGGVGVGVGGAVAWFPLGPREVYVPSYHVSQAYVNRVNITNTTVNVTQVTNVYNTTIIKNNTTINNVTYVNRNVRGGTTAVPQQAFASAQPVARASVGVNPRQFANVPVSSRAAVQPAPQAVLGAHANTANRVAAPPAAVQNRAVFAKTAPPAPPPSFAARQQVMAQHPGQPVSRQQMQRIAPSAASNAAFARVKVVAATKPTAPPPAQPNRPGNPASNQPQPVRPQPGATAQPNQPGNRTFVPPARNDRPQPAQPNQPAPNNADRPQPNPAPNSGPTPNQPPVNNRPMEPPARNDRPSSVPGNNRPQPTPPPNNRPETNRPPEPPARNDRPSSVPSNNRPQPTPPANNRPETNRPEAPPSNRPAEPPARNEHPSSAPPNARPEPTPPPNNRPEANRPQPTQPQPRPETNRPSERPPSEPVRQTPPPQQQHTQPPPNKPAPPPQQRDPNRPPKQENEKPKPPQ